MGGTGVRQPTFSACSSPSSSSRSTGLSQPDVDNLLVRIHFIIVMIRWTGLTPWEFEFPFPGSLTSTFLVCVVSGNLGSPI